MCTFWTERQWSMWKKINAGHREKKPHREKNKASEPSWYEPTVLTGAEHVLLAKLLNKNQSDYTTVWLQFGLRIRLLKDASK